nr:hypothetical protein CPGR_00413 [Mycolicibacter nonchromogenicus]
MVLGRSIGSPLRSSVAPPSSCMFSPVAVMMMSASSSWPEFSRIPFLVNVSIVSVTTSA